jgi:hypothetical protein
MTTIRVTEEHLRGGTCGNPHSCAVALAIDEVIDRKFDHGIPTYHVTVGARSWSIHDLNNRCVARGQLPDEVRELICNFDEPTSRHLCQPLEFEANIPTHLLLVQP